MCVNLGHRVDAIEANLSVSQVRVKKLEAQLNSGPGKSHVPITWLDFFVSVMGRSAQPAVTWTTRLPC